MALAACAAAADAPDDPRAWLAAFRLAEEPGAFDGEDDDAIGAVADRLGDARNEAAVAWATASWPPEPEDDPLALPASIAARHLLESAARDRGVREASPEGVRRAALGECRAAAAAAIAFEVELMPDMAASCGDFDGIRAAMERAPIPPPRARRLAEWRAIAGTGLDDIAHAISHVVERTGLDPRDRCIAIVDSHPLHALRRLRLAMRAAARPGAPRLPLLLLDIENGHVTLDLRGAGSVTRHASAAEAAAHLCSVLVTRGG